MVASGLGEMIGVTVDRKGRLFVSQFRGFVAASGTVALVDPLSGGFTSIEGTSEVFALSADPGADALYVGGYNTGDLYRVEETSPGVWTVTVAASLSPPNRISHALKDGHLLYIACQDSGIWVKDLVTGALTFGVRIPTLATTMAKEMGGHLLVGSEYDVVYRIDPSAWQVVQSYSGFSGPCGVAVDPNDNAVFVADPFLGSISRIDLATGEIVEVTTLPVEPWQIAFAPETAPPPSFGQCARLDGMVRLGWESSPGVALEQTSTLSDPDWKVVSGAQGRSLIELPLDGRVRFFRLVEP